MAIRDKLRKTFNKKASSSGGSSPSGSTSNATYYTGRTDIEYYKPHEIPKSKYKGKVDKAHQESLEAFSFGDAFSTLRRRSSQALSGIVSPGGTKAQSRRPSYMSRASRKSSIARTDNESLPTLSRKVTPAARPPVSDVPRVDEGSDEDADSRNDGLSKQETVRSRKDIPTFQIDRAATVTEGDAAPKIASPTSYEHPFTAEDLEKAMTKANLSGGDGVVHQPSVAVH